MTAAATNGGAVVNGGGGGASLPVTPAEALLDAANAGEVVALAPTTGVGTSIPLDTVVEQGVAMAASTVGDFVVSAGAGGAQLASAAPSAVRSVIGLTNALTVTRYYASDFTAENGSESASKSGTGASSTATLTASATARLYGTGGATAARLVLALPAGTLWATVTLEITAASGVSTAGYRALIFALRDAPNGGAPTRLWGVSLNDNAYCGWGSLMGGVGGAGGASQGPVGSGLGASTSTRVTLNPRDNRLMLAHAAVSGTPAGWSPPAVLPSLVGNSSTLTIPDPVYNSTALVVGLISAGGGGASSVTMKITVDAVVGP